MSSLLWLGHRLHHHLVHRKHRDSTKSSPIHDSPSDVDAHHQGEEVCFHSLENLFGSVVIPGVASRVLDDEEQATYIH